MLPQEVIRDEQAMYDLTRLTQYGTKVFDVKMSDVEEMQFLDQFCVGKTGREMHDGLDNLQQDQTALSPEKSPEMVTMG